MSARYSTLVTAEMVPHVQATQVDGLRLAAIRETWAGVYGARMTRVEFVDRDAPSHLAGRWVGLVLRTHHPTGRVTVLARVVDDSGPDIDRITRWRERLDRIRAAYGRRRGMRRWGRG